MSGASAVEPCFTCACSARASSSCASRFTIPPWSRDYVGYSQDRRSQAMRFGIFYEMRLPRPWAPDDERRLFHEALDQVVLADRLGYDHAWEVEHHFLDEYSHSSAPEVFLAAAAARTSRIRLGHGIRQVIPNYNHPARTAEGLATLDIISNGRVDLGIGEGATRLELGGFSIKAQENHTMSLASLEHIPNIM